MTSEQGEQAGGNSRQNYLKIVSPGLRKTGTSASSHSVTSSFGQPTEKNFNATVDMIKTATDVNAVNGLGTTTTRSITDVVDDFRRLKISCSGCNQKLDVSTLNPFSQFECPVCGTVLKVPQRFDNYLLESAEGLGGMATVYRGRDTTLDREVAIKVLSPAVARDRERCELFLNEARTAATINHYAVVPIYTCGIFEEQPFIVMQFMKNGSLEKKIDTESPPPVLEALKWMKSVSEGLECAHRHGIIHHDVKPGNIMIDNTGNAKIGDFGIAQAINDTRATRIFEITKAWISPHYVSPEKAVSGKEDYRGDIYSLGATFYQIFTGHTPFKNDDIEELIKLRLIQDPPSPRRYNRAIPRRLARLLLDMMQINPLGRPDYEEIIAELDFILSREELHNLRRTLPGRWPVSLRGKLIVVLLALAIWLGFVYCVYRVVSSSGLEEMAVLHSVSPPPDAQVMTAARAFASGDSQLGGELSRKILEDVTMSPKDRKCAALQLAIANFLNNNRYAADNCGYIITKLSEAGISPTSPVTATVRFLERQDIAAADLREKLKDASVSERFAGHLAIFIRNVYSFTRGDGSAKNFTNDLLALQEDVEKVEDTDWTAAWKRRIPIYSSVLERHPPKDKKLEPLFEHFIPNKSN